ncbi:MAG: hypothetical protein IKE62_01790 [Oscillospiraceae bacterium]|nr:hypothetical protein [Oscillospiraceae bacterium]
MAEQVFREEAVDRLSSPEQMNDYVHVTTPRVWITLGAVVLIILGAMIWASLTYISSYMTGVAEVRDGKMTVTLDEDQATSELSVGMVVNVGKTESTILSVGTDSEGRIIAMSETGLTDGYYGATIKYKETQLLRLLFN